MATKREKTYDFVCLLHNLTCAVRIAQILVVQALSQA